MTYNSLCVNNNGNVTFGGGLGQYTPRAFPVASLRMIAPFWGDVDTRGGSLADGSHDAVTWDVRRGQFVATWHNVGYFSIHDELQNDFQLVLRAFEGCGVGDFDVEFRYNRCEWVTGDASGGSHGHGGTAAQAGFDAGDRLHFYALPGSLTEMISLLCRTSNIADPGVWRFRIRGGEIPCSGSGVPCSTGMVGACADGITTCHGGSATCDALAAASPERCDGVDNDCNGTVDDGPTLCAIGSVCDQGACVPYCVESGCFDQQTCTDGGRCVDQGCIGMTCPAGLRCVRGTCLDPCVGLHCPMPSVCRLGGCLVPCDGVVCDVGQVCENGRCLGSCECRACPDGYLCATDGTCQPGDCLGRMCAPGQVCLSALLQEPGGAVRCVDPCVGAVCPERQHCEAGRCAPGSPVDGGVVRMDAASTEGGRGVPLQPPRRLGCQCGIPRSGELSARLITLALAVLGVIARRSRSRTRARRRCLAATRHPG
ncbi:MAG: nidogen-like domain-containing protein [Deltaproteobacteria bacterium]